MYAEVTYIPTVSNMIHARTDPNDRLTWWGGAVGGPWLDAITYHTLPDMVVASDGPGDSLVWWGGAVGAVGLML